MPSSVSNLTVKKFAKDHRFMNMSHAYDSFWSDPNPNKDFLLVKDDNGTDHPWRISMFHQLHCLAIIRTAMQGYMEGGKSMEHGHGYKKGPGIREAEILKNADAPWLYCFNYLRQTILCAADSTLEPLKKSHKYRINLDGLEEDRVCRNSDALYDFISNRE
ncbi:MAG: hypothetical protein M1834_008040 [Cirrosporium novae-zelandiae]|nr:MAG: hypothetical protein M1834_008040 [Cirrosporium novae-zelandiae]